MVSMGGALNTYVVFAAVALGVKYLTGLNRLLVDVLFLCIVIALLCLNLSLVLNEKCSASAAISAGEVFKAVFFPWVVMVGGIVALLHVFPGWKQPFSNTFGYLAIHIPTVGAKAKLLAILPEDKAELKVLIESEPSLLFNEFNLANFDAQMERMNVKNAAATASFKGIILLKELVAEFMWIILAGSVALITSFNILMNAPCT